MLVPNIEIFNKKQGVQLMNIKTINLSFKLDRLYRIDLKNVFYLRSVIGIRYHILLMS